MQVYMAGYAYVEEGGSDTVLRKALIKFISFYKLEGKY